MGEHSHTAIAKLESYDTFDRIDIKIPRPLAGESNPSAIRIYLTPRQLVAIYQTWGRPTAFPDLMAESLQEHPTAAGALLALIDCLSRQDSQMLQGIEQEIADLEDSLLESRRKDYTGDIIALRKRLLEIRFYYEQLSNLLDELDAEDNQFMNQKRNRFHNLEKRIGRLNATAVNLRDYLSQVREAYQSQTDIALNQLMKIFTVITTIFLPLTLVTGWYGMNFVMPEYQWAYSYPVVIAVCLVILLGCVLFFKKKRWF